VLYTIVRISHPRLLFLSPIGSLGGHVRANGCWRFHSVLWASQWELSYTLPLLSCFLYNPKFWLADCSTCHVLSRWFLARLILWPWRWKRYVPPKRGLIFNGLHGVISKKIVLFIAVSLFCSLYTNISSFLRRAVLLCGLTEFHRMRWAAWLRKQMFIPFTDINNIMAPL
jgi:hypothetical protein